MNLTLVDARRRALLSVAAGALPLVALGQAASGPEAPDIAFATHAALASMAEVEAGALAQQHGSSDKVRQFGALMVRDHSQAGDQLKRIAAAKNLALPTALDEAHRKAGSQLAAASDGDFDRRFKQQMVADHQRAIELFERQARSGRDPDLKAFAERLLPALREHLKQAQAL